MDAPSFDVAVIGGGIVGLATAREAAGRPGTRVVVLEAEDRVAAHQTGHNSGVIHSGLYYRPGSLKARNCVEGREAMYRFCEERGVPHERCGKLVVATDETELPALDELERRGRANGLGGVRRLDPGAVGEREPYVRCAGALLVPETGIVDYAVVGRAFAEDVRERGGEVRTDARVLACRRTPGGSVIETTGGAVTARSVVNCGGLQADRVMQLCGERPPLRIVPFRGEYYELVPGRRDLVRHLVYPVPDPGLPFLGVHLTRTVGGRVEAGPNALLALARHGYGRLSFSLRDALDVLSYPGFWRLSRRYWRTGLAEMLRSFSKRAFVRALRKLVPELGPRDVRRAGAGVRAQALERDGSLADDFRIVTSDHVIHVLNAPSPAATASIAIGRRLAAMVLERSGTAGRARSKWTA